MWEVFFLFFHFRKKHISQQWREIRYVFLYFLYVLALLTTLFVHLPHWLQAILFILTLTKNNGNKALLTHTMADPFLLKWQFLVQKSILVYLLYFCTFQYFVYFCNVFACSFVGMLFAFVLKYVCVWEYVPKLLPIAANTFTMALPLFISFFILLLVAAA